VPSALKRVFSGVVPSPLALDLDLPPGTSFETLESADVEVADCDEDHRLVGHLATLAIRLKKSRLDLSAPAFPQGLTSTIKLARLPFRTRTRNWLKRRGLYSVDALARLSLGKLFAIRGFSVCCLVDLLTALEAQTATAERDAVTAGPVATVPEVEALTFSTRLTERDRVLGSERWSKDVSKDDGRFGHWLLKDEGEFKVVQEALAIAPRARRRLVPRALEAAFTANVPSRLALDLKLPPGTSFEILVPTDVEVGDRTEEHRLLGQLAALAHHAIKGGLNLSIPAFPQGLTSIDLAQLPLRTRTRNCLEREGLFSVDALRRLSLRELFAIPGFGVNCLVDLLTAVEADQPAAVRHAVTAGPFAELREIEAVTLSPRLTRAAHLLGSEPWSNDVSLYDIRFVDGLLRDDAAITVVRDALVTGRLSFDQPLCPEPARRELDLLLCPLEPRTRKLLLKAGLTTLSALVPLTVRALLRSAGFGLHSMADLVAMLDLCRILSSASEPIDVKPTLADFCRALVDRTRDPWCPDRLADRIDHTRAAGIRCLSLPLEQELSDLAASTRGSCPDVVIECLGWDGRHRRAWGKVAHAHGWTAGRVRENASRLTDQFAGAPPWAPALRRALDFCERAHPLPVEEIASQLQQNGLATGPFHPRSLITAARVFGLTHTLSVVRFRGARWLFSADQRMFMKKSIGSARSIAVARGVCSVAHLQARISKCMSRVMPEDTLRDWLLRLPQVHWLDEEREWFRFRNHRGSLETALWKILAVAPEIHVGELRNGLMRPHRSPAAPPLPVLSQLCRDLGLEVDGDLVRTRKPVRPQDVLAEHELTFFEILSADGPLLPRRDLEKRCLQRGMNRNSFNVYVSTSPILARFGRGLHGLRGAQLGPGEAEVQRRPARLSGNVTNFGWKKSGVPWIARRLTEATIRSGFMVVPAAMSDAVGEGRLPLLTVDGLQVGNLGWRRAHAWGLSPAFRRCRPNVGDVMILEIDRKSAAAIIHLGGPELLVQGPPEMNVPADERLDSCRTPSRTVTPAPDCDM